MEAMVNKISLTRFADAGNKELPRVLCGVLTGYVRHFPATVYGNRAEGEFIAHLSNGDKYFSSVLQLGEHEIDRIRNRHQHDPHTPKGLAIAYRVWNEVNPETNRRHYVMEWML